MATDGEIKLSITGSTPVSNDHHRDRALDALAEVMEGGHDPDARIAAASTYLRTLGFDA